MRIREILSEARIYNRRRIDNFINYYAGTLPQQAKDLFKRIITKSAQDPQNQERPNLEPDATEWDRKDLENGTLVEFNPSNELSNKLDHIWDWITIANFTIQDLDSLRGIQDVDIAYEHANRYFARLNKRASSDEDESGLETIMSWPDGFKLVKLNTAKCLNREGKLMQHCVGSYANEIQRGTEILSLRDPHNNPHVTIEKKDNNILQIKGKNNQIPIEKYRDYIKDYLNENNFGEILSLHWLGMIKINDKIYNLKDIETLPENFIIDHDLHIGHSKINILPTNLTINGSLNISNCPIKELPKGLKINGKLQAISSKLESLHCRMI